MATYASIAYDFAPATADQGALKFIKELTASSSSTLSFVDGASSVVLDNTYKNYIFKFIDMHPSEAEEFTFQCSTDGGSNYNTTVTSTAFYSYHNEDGAEAALAYYANADQAQGTAFEWLTDETSTDNDSCASGELWLSSPSSTTFVKHYLAISNIMNPSPYSLQLNKAGYFNTTSAIDAVQFKFNSGDMDAGTIRLYGIA